MLMISLVHIAINMHTKTKTHTYKFLSQLAIILYHTRESAIQSSSHLRSIGSPLRVTARAFVGGASTREDRTALTAGVQVVCATPGRAFDLMARAQWDVTGVKLIVFDRFLDLKQVEMWEQALRDVFAKLPSKVQACVLADNKEVLDKLSALLKRELIHIAA